MNVLNLFEILHGPSEGSFVCLLDRQSEETPWRLDLMYDLRWKPKPTWVFQTWKNNRTDEYQTLERDEIYGFLKSRFPTKNWRRIIFEEVKTRTIRLFDAEEKTINLIEGKQK